MPRNDMPGNLPEMRDDEVLDFLLSLQPERQREMTHAPRRDPKFPKSSVPYTSWKDDLPAGHTIADIGDYFEDSANAPLYPLYHNDAGRPRGNPENFIPPELRKFLRLPLNVGMDIADIFRPETPAEVAAMAFPAYGPASGALRGVRGLGDKFKDMTKVSQRYKGDLGRRGMTSGDAALERRNARTLQSGVLSVVVDDARKAFFEEEPQRKAGGGKVTRRGVLKGLGALGIAGALGKKGVKMGDEAAEVAAPIERRAMAKAIVPNWMPSASFVKKAKEMADNFDAFNKDQMVEDGIPFPKDWNDPNLDQETYGYFLDGKKLADAVRGLTDSNLDDVTKVKRLEDIYRYMDSAQGGTVDFDEVFSLLDEEKGIPQSLRDLINKHLGEED